tara:strand:+ start:38 stop:484 length:447 start_codon:yes stop_codon:yes gene_type:complete
MASKFIRELMKKGAQKLAGQSKTTGKEGIKFIKPDLGKLKKTQDAKKKITDITDKYAVGFAKDNPKLLKKFRQGSKKNLDSISKIYKDSKKEGGRIGRKFGSPDPKKQNIEKMNRTFNAQKSDLNKDGKLSGYEKKRGKVIAQAMKKK